MLYFLLPRTFRKWVRLIRKDEQDACGLLQQVEEKFHHYNREVAAVQDSGFPPATRIDILRNKETAFKIALMNLNSPIIQAQLRGEPDPPGSLSKDEKLDILEELVESDMAQRKLLMNRVLKKGRRQSTV